MQATATASSSSVRAADARAGFEAVSGATGQAYPALRLQQLGPRDRPSVLAMMLRWIPDVPP